MKQNLQYVLLTLLCAVILTACQYPRITDTARTDVEQMLLTSAAENSIRRIDFSNYAGKKVKPDFSLLATQTDKEFVQAVILYHMADNKITVVEDAAQADYIFQPFCAILATDSSKVLFGTPSLPVPIPRMEINLVIPDLPLFMKYDRIGHARFFFTITDAKTAKPVEITRPSTSVTKHCNWSILLFPFETSSELPDFDDKGLHMKTKYFWED